METSMQFGIAKAVKDTTDGGYAQSEWHAAVTDEVLREAIEQNIINGDILDAMNMCSECDFVRTNTIKAKYAGRASGEYAHILAEGA